MLAGLLLAVVPSAHAQFSGGSGTEADPYLISSPADLNAVRGAHLGSLGTPRYYRQTADIDLSGIANWEPIGSLSTAAYVHYDGNHKRILNLTINRAAESGIGLFGYLVSGSIRNLYLESGSVTANFFAGSMAGRMDNGTIEGSESRVAVSGANNIGGFVGYFQGGLLRHSAYRAAAVSGANTVGGLVGYNAGGSIETSFAAGSVSGTGNTGGLVGLSGSGAVVTQSYWDTQASTQGSSSGGGTGVTTAGMMQRATFSGWNFTTVWRLYTGKSYPYLQALAREAAPPSFDPDGGAFPGSSVDVEITSATPGAFIHYTTNGTAPTDSSPAIASGSVVPVPIPAELKAVAWVPYRNPSPILSAVFTAAPKAATPQFAPGGGSYAGAAIDVTMTSATTNSTLRYTLDGSEPTASTGTAVTNGGTVSVTLTDEGTTLKVRAFRADLNPSDVATAVYTTASTVGAPVFSPAGGTHAGATVDVLVTCNTPDAVIYYTTDGSEPTESSPDTVVSGATITLALDDAITTLAARAFHPDLNPSVITSADYHRAAQAEMPEFDPPGGMFAGSSVVVAITSPTDGALIRYTLDGTDPDTGTLNTVTNGGTVTVSLTPSGTTLKARAFRDDLNPSPVASALYEAAPSVAIPLFAQEPGEPEGTVRITCATPGAVIRYTTDGLTPAVDSPVIADGGVVTVPVPGTLKAKAWKDGMNPSAVQTAYYGGFAGGAGTPDEPYLVAIPEHLDHVRSHLGAAFQLIDDIDLGVNPWNSGSGWLPIGSAGSAFTGAFDGNGHVVSNLFIERPSTEVIGLFGLIGTAGKITNLGIVGGAVTGMNYVGGLAGYSEGVISNCFATCDVAGNIFFPIGGAGGLVGRGAASGVVVNSYATGHVSGSMNLGGLIGYSQSAITHCYAAGVVDAATDAGGLIGKYVSGSVVSAYWGVTASGRATSGGGQGSGRTTTQMQQQATFSGWHFDHVWEIDEGVSYPELQLFNREPFRIPDAWLIQYYGSVEDAPNMSVKGYPLWWDYIAGLDPTDPGSLFVVTEVTLPATVLNLHVTSVPGRLYRVQSRASLLAGSWQVVAGVGEQPGTGEDLIFNIPVSGDPVFYCVSVRLAE